MWEVMHTCGRWCIHARFLWCQAASWLWRANVGAMNALDLGTGLGIKTTFFPFFCLVRGNPLWFFKLLCTVDFKNNNVDTHKTCMNRAHILTSISLLLIWDVALMSLWFSFNRPSDNTQALFLDSGISHREFRLQNDWAQAPERSSGDMQQNHWGFC